MELLPKLSLQYPTVSRKLYELNFFNRYFETYKINQILIPKKKTEIRVVRYHGLTATAAEYLQFENAISTCSDTL